MKKIPIGYAADLTEKVPRAYVADGKPIVVIKWKEQFYSYDDVCLHKGGPLSEGTLVENVLTCPWHQWKWDVETGQSLTNPSLKLNSYRTTVEDSKLFVEMK